MVFSKEEKRIAKDLIWKCSMRSSPLPFGPDRSVERTTHFAFSGGRTTSQTYGSYSSQSLTNSFTGSVDPVRRMRRKVTKNVGRYVPPADETIPSDRAT